MDIKIFPARLQGQIHAPSSKSHAHRLLICAALGNEPVYVTTGLCADVQATISCLKALGARIEGSEPHFLVTPITRASKTPTLRCGQSGSTLRFLLPVVAALGCGATFVCDPQLAARPITPFLEVLNAHGCTTSEKNGVIQLSGKLAGGDFLVAGDISSQFISGILLAAMRLAGETHVCLTTPVQSERYIQLTAQTLSQWGTQAIKQTGGWRVTQKGTNVCPNAVVAEGDWSGAAFWLSVPSQIGSIHCSGLHANGAQPDEAISVFLSRAGINLKYDENSIFSTGDKCKGIEVDISQTPDLITPLALAALYWYGETTLLNAGRTRLKESDRLHAIHAGFSQMGAQITQQMDSLTIQGGLPLRGGCTVDGFDDHRVVIALCLAACGCAHPVVIKGAEAVHKSYPMFFEDFRKVGGKYYVL